MALRHSTIALILSACIGCAQVAQADDTTASDSPELTAAKAAAALAEAKQKQAEAELALAKAQIGTFDASGLPTGKATVTDMDLEGTLRAYAAVKEITDTIATDVSTLATGGVVLATEAQLQQLNQYRAFLTQMKLLNDNTVDVIKQDPKLEPPPECLGAPAGPRRHFLTADVAAGLVLLSTVLDVAALFKTDVELKGKAVTLNDDALAALMLKSLKGKNVDVVFPGNFYVLPPSASEGAAVKAYKAVADLKSKLRDGVAELVKKYQAMQKTYDKPKECKDAVTALGTIVDNYNTAVTAAQKAIDDVGTTLTKQDGASGLSLISTYLVSERLQQAIASRPVLIVKAVVAGGSTRTEKGWFSTSIHYGGGSVIAYRLFSQDGAQLAADVIPWYAGFLGADQFKAGRVALSTTETQSASAKDSSKANTGSP